MKADLRARVETRIRELMPELTALRQALHREPEIGHTEFKTQMKIRDYLKGTALAARKPLLTTDVVADLPGKAGPTILLRADIDALPIEEKTGALHASCHAGLMHACGHDGHTAILAGAAKVLSEFKEHIPCSIRFVFQPGEERFCLGRHMVEKGVCEGVEAAYALHGWPGLPVGTVSTRQGALFAAGGSFKIDLTGKGCHGAIPAKGKNPIPVGADLVGRLFQLHKSANSLDGSVITVCQFQSGTASTIIPGEAHIEGTARYLSTARGDEIEAAVRDAVAGAISGTGVKADINYDRLYSLPVLNSPSGYQTVKKTALDLWGASRFIETAAPSMGNEDFAFYLNGREGAMFWLGLGESCAPMHNAAFDFNDKAIEAGVMMFCALALGYGTGQ